MQIEHQVESASIEKAHNKPIHNENILPYLTNFNWNDWQIWNFERILFFFFWNFQTGKNRITKLWRNNKNKIWRKKKLNLETCGILPRNSKKNFYELTDSKHLFQLKMHAHGMFS